MPISDSSQTLYFCTRCGRCCCWPGYVDVSSDELDRIAAYLGVSVASFTERYMILRHDRKALVLSERDNKECIFFQSPAGCLIYPVRPRQCREFPYSWTVPNLHEHCATICLRYKIYPVQNPKAPGTNRSPYALP